MKRSMKFATIVALTLYGVLIPQSNISAMTFQSGSSLSTWVARSLEEVLNSIKQTQQTGMYTVQWGDTLSTISKATGVSIQELSQLNNITDIDLIIAGSTLYVDYVNHTITYVAPAEDAVTVSTVTGERMESPAESISQLMQTEESVDSLVEQNASEAQVPHESVTTQVSEESAVMSEENLPLITEVKEPVSEELTTTIATENEQNVTELSKPEETQEPAGEVSEEMDESETIDPTVQGTPITVEATAYSYQEAGLSSFTADGTDLTQDSRVIAVDPSVIPLGTMVYIPGYGTYRAADTGGAIVGNKIDVHFNTVEECYQFGRRQLTIYILK